MKKQGNSDLVQVFSGSLIEAEIVKILLEDSEIKTYLKDEYTGALAPFNTSAGGVAPVKVIVANKNFEAAKIIVEKYKHNASEE